MISLMNLAVDMIIDGLSYIESILICSSDIDCAVICVRILLLIVYFYESFFGFFESVFRL